MFVWSMFAPKLRVIRGATAKEEVMMMVYDDGKDYDNIDNVRVVDVRCEVVVKFCKTKGWHCLLSLRQNKDTCNIVWSMFQRLKGTTWSTVWKENVEIPSGQCFKGLSGQSFQAQAKEQLGAQSEKKMLKHLKIQIWVETWEHKRVRNEPPNSHVFIVGY